MNLKTGAILIVAAAAAVVAAAVVVPSRQSHVLAVEGRSNASPSIAALGPFVATAWGATTQGGPTDIYVAVSRDAGRTFGSPTRVSNDRSPASLSGEQPPSLTLVPRAGQDPSLVVIWTAKTPAGTRLFSSRSDDGSRSFTPPTALPGSDAPGNRGWQATATDRDGRVMTIWLDHRELAVPADGAAPADHAVHQHSAQHAQPSDGAARAQLSKLFFARLDEPDGSRPLAGGVCYCCKTAIAAGSDGAVYAAWRHVYPGNIRDIAFAASRDGGRTFTAPGRVSEDGWVLDGCPENGPSMVIDAQQRVHVVWPTLLPGRGTSEPTLALFYARSDDGRQFATRQRLPTEGVPRHVQIALAPGGSVALVWDEGSDGLRRVAFGAGVPDATGRLQWQRRMVSGDGVATYPVLASVEDGVVAAWTRDADPNAVIHVERLRLTN